MSYRQTTECTTCGGSGKDKDHYENVAFDRGVGFRQYDDCPDCVDGRIPVDRCPNCQSPDLRADLVLWGNHYCTKNGERQDPSTAWADGG